MLCPRQLHFEAGLRTPTIRRLLKRRQPRLLVISHFFRLERLPGGVCTHWKAPPLHGAHPIRTLRSLVWRERRLLSLSSSQFDHSCRKPRLLKNGRRHVAKYWAAKLILPGLR